MEEKMIFSVLSVVLIIIGVIVNLRLSKRLKIGKTTHEELNDESKSW